MSGGSPQVAIQANQRSPKNYQKNPKHAYSILQLHVPCFGIKDDSISREVWSLCIPKLSWQWLPKTLDCVD